MLNGRVLQRGFIVGLLAIGVTLQAVDLDVEGARRRYESQKALADQAESNYRADERAFQSAEGQYLNELSREKKYRESVDDHDREVRNLANSITSVENEIPRIEQNLRTAESDRSRIQSALTGFQRDEQKAEMWVNRSQSELRRVESDLAAERAKTPPDEAAIARLETRRNQTQSELNQAQADLRNAQQSVRTCQHQIRNLDSQIASYQSDLSQKRLRLSQLERSRQQALMDLQSARDDLRRQEENVRFARNRVEDARRPMTASKSEWDRQERLAQQAYQEYQTVVGNYNRERDRVVKAAEAKGSGDGQREGSDRAPADGQRSGDASASKVAADAGSAEARSIQMNAGYRSARANPAQEPVSYSRGTAEGVAIAVKKANAEDFPRGYNEALARALQSEPSQSATVEVDEANPPAGGEDGGVFLTPTTRVGSTVASPAYGLPTDPAYKLPAMPDVSVTAPGADRRYFSSDCTGLALAEFEPVCRKSYETAYVSGFTSAYKSVFLQNHRSTYAANVTAYYDAARAQGFPTEYRAGVEKGALHQGILDGFAARLAVARQEQYAAGEMAWASYLASGHLVRVRSASLNEQSGDGLHTPGEKGEVSLIVDNLGGKPAPGGSLIAELSKQTGVEVKKSSNALPAIAADTKVTVNKALSGLVLPAKAGASLRMEATVKYLGGVSLGSAEASAEVHFPIELQSMTLAARPKVDEEVDATLKFKNLTAFASTESALRLFTNPTIAWVSGTTAVPALQAGEEVEVAAKVKPGVWVGRNVEVPFMVETKDQGGIAGAITQVFPQLIDVDRSGSLLLYDSAGREVKSGVFTVNANSRLVLQIGFQYQRTTPTPGPFNVRAGERSDPAFRHTNNSTVGIGHGNGSPGRKYSTMTLSYDIPASLKGKDLWALVNLSEGNKAIHVLRFEVKVR